MPMRRTFFLFFFRLPDAEVCLYQYEYNHFFCSTLRDSSGITCDVLLTLMNVNIGFTIISWTATQNWHRMLHRSVIRSGKSSVLFEVEVLSQVSAWMTTPRGKPTWHSKLRRLSALVIVPLRLPLTEFANLISVLFHLLFSRKLSHGIIYRVELGATPLQFCMIFLPSSTSKIVKKFKGFQKIHYGNRGLAKFVNVHVLHRFYRVLF